MLLKTLREEVLEANLELVRRSLVLYTFGNVSGRDRGEGLVAIKPSGIPYGELTASHMVVSDLAGKIVDENLRPSSELTTHLELYKQFNSESRPRARELHNKHFLRQHGRNAYYGQVKPQ
jgi:L-ribulose-5-phosphate 4-epimerase